MTLAAKIKALRTKHRKSLQEVATAVGASKAHIWDIERGESKNPSLELLKKIADYFDTSVGELVGEKHDAEGEPQELVAMYRGLKELKESDREVIKVLMQELLKRRDK